MSENKRQHPRTPFVCKLKLIHPAAGELVVKTRDISDSGAYVELDASLLLPLGTVLTGQVQGLMDEAPLLPMKVVRTDAAGMGLRFLVEE